MMTDLNTHTDTQANAKVIIESLPVRNQHAGQYMDHGLFYFLYHIGTAKSDTECLALIQRAGHPPLIMVGKWEDVAVSVFVEDWVPGKPTETEMEAMPIWVAERRAVGDFFEFEMQGRTYTCINASLYLQTKNHVRPSA